MLNDLPRSNVKSVKFCVLKAQVAQLDNLVTVNPVYLAPEPDGMPRRLAAHCSTQRHSAALASGWLQSRRQH